MHHLLASQARSSAWPSFSYLSR